MVQLKKISLKKIYVLHEIRPSHYTNSIHSWLCLVAIIGFNLNRVQKKKIHRDCSSSVWTSMKLSKHESASVHDTNSDRTRARHGLDGPAKRNHFSSGAGLYCSILCVFSMVTRISSTKISSLFLVKNLFL